MISLSKTALVLSVIVCGALTVGIRAQEPDEPQPRPRPRPRQEKTARPAPRPAPEDMATETDAPAPPAPSDTSPAPFAGPPGLSEEAMRSFREISPRSATEQMESPADEPAPPDEAPAPQRPSRPAPPLPSRTAPARIQPRPEYIVEPPDMLIVEVLEALPGRPISGERLVRPDGRISLGFYGEVPVAGLTLPQIKERLVLHLRKWLSDEILGLLQIDEETNLVKRDSNGRIVVKDPRENDRVFVDVTAYNSQHYYVLGEVWFPRRLPYTGGDTVLDLLEYAGGLLQTADKSKIRLIRSYPKGSPARVLPVDYEEIAMGTDSSTNYQILPNDRLVIPRIASSRLEADAGRGASRAEYRVPNERDAPPPSQIADPDVEGSPYFNRSGYFPGRGRETELEKRIDELEKKLDRLIEVVENNQPRRAAEPDVMIPKLPLVERSPFAADDEPSAAGRMVAPGGRPADESAATPGPRSPRARRVEPMSPGRWIPRRSRREEPRRGAARQSTRPDVEEGIEPASDRPSTVPRIPESTESPFDDAPAERSPR